MKFRSPTDQPIHISLTTGHTAVITPDGVPLDPMFHKEASSRGAVVFDEGSAAPALDVAPIDRRAVIAEALNAMLDGKVEDDFTTDGKPNLYRLRAKVGFSVSREEADAVFAEVTAEKV